MVKSKLKRNGEIIRNSLELKKGMYIAKDDLTIIFPSRYMDIDLCIVSNSILLLGILMIKNKNDIYGVMNVPTYIRLSFSNIEKQIIDGVEYSLLNYEKGDIVIENKDCIVTESTLYPIFNNFLTLGKVPFFLESNDLKKIFSKSRKYNGSRIGNNPLGMELIASRISRAPSDLNLEYRFETTNKPPVYKGLNNVFYTIDSNLNRISGAFTKSGLLKAVNDDSEREASPIEKILRA